MEAAPTKPTSTKPATEPIRSSTAEITESEISTAESLEIDEDILGELLALSNEELIQLLDTLKANSLWLNSSLKQTLIFKTTVNIF